MSPLSKEGKDHEVKWQISHSYALPEKKCSSRPSAVGVFVGISDIPFPLPIHRMLGLSSPPDALSLPPLQHPPFFFPRPPTLNFPSSFSPFPSPLSIHRRKGETPAKMTLFSPFSFHYFRLISVSLYTLSFLYGKAEPIRETRAKNFPEKPIKVAV